MHTMIWDLAKFVYAETGIRHFFLFRCYVGFKTATTKIKMKNKPIPCTNAKAKTGFALETWKASCFRIHPTVHPILSLDRHNDHHNKYIAAITPCHSDLHNDPSATNQKFEIECVKTTISQSEENKRTIFHLKKMFNQTTKNLVVQINLRLKFKILFRTLRVQIPKSQIDTRFTFSPWFSHGPQFLTLIFVAPRFVFKTSGNCFLIHRFIDS